ncbi:hypothetical protein [Okeania sp. KiyG1]|uniref:hypothetical protein n=1 Tax=Okeania sp. KiyG1 TaxID=2720165 RepID=UPI0019226A6B|nr:hypothetical protein [Okeania sp. KiyG1]
MLQIKTGITQIDCLTTICRGEWHSPYTVKPPSVGAFAEHDLRKWHSPYIVLALAAALR